MKNFIKISFPENRKMGDIVIKRALKMGQTEDIIIDVDKEENDKQICLSDHKCHYLTDLKLVSINSYGLGEELADKHQEVVLRGYYHRENQRYVIPCILKYNIYDGE